MITLEGYFGRVSHIEEPTLIVQGNAAILLERVNALLEECSAIEAAAAPAVNSGWRPVSYNAELRRKWEAGEPGGAPAALKSKHTSGEAVDILDPEGELDDFLFNNPQILARHSLWMEHPLATKGWCHLQSVPPRSGNRIFYP